MLSALYQASMSQIAIQLPYAPFTPCGGDTGRGCRGRGRMTTTRPPKPNASSATGGRPCGLVRASCIVWGGAAPAACAAVCCCSCGRHQHAQNRHCVLFVEASAGLAQ